ncbi:hypothetical protein LZ198_17250 [Myxococcus sp. K15C18031901]|uniref:MXAN_6627.5 family MYXO-CTERM protein n=1 Tax=Myxococcus dinghuensis TaxID=2906761 RepID=UPI0020A83432|nr:MXAN_6627.5 family MYXO-CTERM protein [Myxococcus dinghuensis]MCP3100620.1 hypothetical protein [Myxococcus dinghuensis]
MASSFRLSRAQGLALLACLPLLLPAAALAQSSEDGGVIINVPDASSGEGGADRDNPEQDDGTGRVTTSCRSTKDCSPRFTCQSGSCRYTGVRQANQQGCVLGAEAALLVVGLAAMAVPRQKR